jgi:hypothetical protein
MCISFGKGRPFPVSTRALTLIRNIAHFVLQWCSEPFSATGLDRGLSALAGAA